MNAWLWAATGFILCLIPCGVVCARGDPLNRLVGLETAGVVEVLAPLLMAEGFHRPLFVEIALAAALLAFAGGLVFARFLERWL